MKYIFIFALTLSFASCGTNEPSHKGKLTNLTVSDGKASFKLDEVQYTNVMLLSQSAQTMSNSCGQEVEVWFENNSTEISQVRNIAAVNTFWKYATIVFGGTLLLIVLIGGFPANDGTDTRYNANRGTNWQDSIKY